MLKYAISVMYKDWRLVYSLAFLIPLIGSLFLQSNLISNVISLGGILVLPGWLIVRLWKDSTAKYEKLIYSVAISLCAMLLIGLIINTTMPLLGYSKALDRKVVQPVIMASVTLLLVYSLHRKRISIKILDLKRNFNPLLVMGLCLPLIVVGGANRLNAMPKDWLATLALVLIIIYSLIILWLAKTNQSKSFIPFHIFIISVSLLWMYSLRSHYVFGFDISTEFHYFTQTLKLGRWIPSHSPYNACLSITMLPTMIANFTGIGAESIFKVVYPALFSVVPVAIYAIGRRYFSVFSSALGSFLYIFQQSFLFQSTALARQEIAMVFLSAALLAFFNNKWSAKKRRVLFILFSFGMILSHYSTTYIAAAAYVSTFIVTFIYARLSGSRFPKYRLSASITGIIVVSAITWNLQITQSSSNLFQTIGQSITSIPHVFQADAQRSVVAQSIIGTPLASGNELTQKYFRQHSASSNVDLINDATSLPLSGPTGKSMFIVKFVHFYLPYIIKLFVIISVPYYFFSKKSRLPITYILISTAILLFGVLLVLVPNLSLDYNVERIYQQNLILLAVPAVDLMLLVSARFRIYGAVSVVAILFAYFIMTSSLFDKQFLNWSNANIGNLNEATYTFYATDGDRLAVEWLNASNPYNYKIYGDRYGALRAITFSPPYVSTYSISDNLLLGATTHNSYVFLDTTNLVDGRSYYQLNGQVFCFSTPNRLINGNKNSIYSSQVASIYR